MLSEYPNNKRQAEYEELAIGRAIDPESILEDAKKAGAVLSVSPAQQAGGKQDEL
jgi:hypothetical protein